MRSVTNAGYNKNNLKISVATAYTTVMIKMPFAVLSLRVFMYSVNSIALASNETLIMVVRKGLLCITVSKKTPNGMELAFHK